MRWWERMMPDFGERDREVAQAAYDAIGYWYQGCDWENDPIETIAVYVAKVRAEERESCESKILALREALKMFLPTTDPYFSAAEHLGLEPVDPENEEGSAAWHRARALLGEDDA